MTKVKLKTRNVIIAVGCLVVLIVASVGIFKWKKQLDYQKTYEYKLQKHGYSEEDTNYLISKLSEAELDTILEEESANANLPKIMKENYYLKKNHDKYLAYMEANPDKSLTDIITIINVGADKEWYSEFVNTDIEKDNLMLTNKFHRLGEDYNPEDLENVKNWYAYGNEPKLRREAYQQFIGMYNAAKKDNQDIIINSSYRSYKYQENLYNDYLNSMGQTDTDAIAARPGFSEHQTGLTIDVTTYGANNDTFDTTEEFAWLQEHAHEYGYILRYPKGKEYITGYNYESWHYRYVGIEAATEIHNRNITFDEYYAYFIEGE